MELLAAKKNMEDPQQEDVCSLEAMDGIDDDLSALDELPEVMIKGAQSCSPLFAHL